MQVQVSRWGNSLAVRIPAAVLAQACVEEGSSLEILVEEDGAIVLVAANKAPTMADLVGAITPENTHTATNWGAPVGNEIW